MQSRSYSFEKKKYKKEVCTRFKCGKPGCLARNSMSFGHDDGPNVAAMDKARSLEVLHRNSGTDEWILSTACK